MQLKTYKEIEHELLGLGRREQYVILLQTSEWSKFRQKQLLSHNEICQRCGVKAGPIEEPIAIDEWEKAQEKYYQQMREFKDRKKTQTKEEFFRDLMAGIYVGQPILPNRVKEIGRTILQVHHRLYYFNKLPWQYLDNEMMVLCVDCHMRLHASEVIYTYKDESRSFRRLTPPCPKCEHGYIHEFRHRDNGICYECWGEGISFDSSPVWEAVNR